MKKRYLEIILFLLIMFLTFYTLFHGQQLSNILKAVSLVSPAAIAAALCLALFFVSLEGFMIWYLLHAMHGKSTLLQCICYSFVGFFYSGITPSATGGQPMQLYYLQKDGNKISDSTVVLMTVALVYKLVLVIMGLFILCFWYTPLKLFLKKYFWLYILGLFLNTLLVLLLLGVMLFPKIILKSGLRLQSLLIRIHVWSPSSSREEKLADFISSYQRAVRWLRAHKAKLGFIIGLTFLQRLSVFFLTYVIYLGFHLHTAGIFSVLCLQASVYIAVDMLPLPGAQGITEMMYRSIFSSVFPGSLLIPSMLITRGINFYFLLLVSLLVTLTTFKFSRRKRRSYSRRAERLPGNSDRTLT